MSEQQQTPSYAQTVANEILQGWAYECRDGCLEELEKKIIKAIEAAIEKTKTEAALYPYWSVDPFEKKKR